MHTPSGLAIPQRVHGIAHSVCRASSALCPSRVGAEHESRRTNGRSARREHKGLRERARTAAVGHAGSRASAWHAVAPRNASSRHRRIFSRRARRKGPHMRRGQFALRRCWEYWRSAGQCASGVVRGTRKRQGEIRRRSDCTPYTGGRLPGVQYGTGHGKFGI